ncbi:hypothetical protein, partial [Thioclava sp. F34-6]|uniref:hypothetical protein n=1 Tax=Thioclava sp. F34-6 TaxID=1973003 RepID=UPI001981A9AE
GRHQPVTLSKAGKLCLRAVELWGADQKAGNSDVRRSKKRRQSKHQPGSGRGWMKDPLQVMSTLPSRFDWINLFGTRSLIET